MAEYAAVALAQSFQQDLARGDANAIMDMSRRWATVEAGLSEQIEALAEQIAKIVTDGGTVPASKLYQMERYQSLLAQLQAQMNAYSQAAIVDLMDDATRSQQMARQHAKQMLGAASSAPSGPGAIQTALDKLGVEATEKIAALARGGNPLDQIFQKAYPAAAAGLTDQLLRGAALGWNPRKTAAAAKKAGLVQGLNHILLVYRDQQIRNYREAQLDAYNANPYVYGYMRLAAKNDRTCAACLRLDGEIYELGEHMPLHPQDRCAIIPLIEGQPLPQWKRGLDWLREQSPEAQRKVLGRQRFELWRQGLFDLNELATVGNHPVWGPTARVTPVKALLHGHSNGIVSKTAAATLAAYKANQPQAGARTLQLDQDDKALIGQLIGGLPKLQSVGLTAKKGIKAALEKMGAGQRGFTYLDDSGVLSGAISYHTKSGNATLLEVTQAGFASDAANLKALQDVAAVAQASGQGVELYVPKGLVNQYLGWGFTIHSSQANGSVMRLSVDDVPAFLSDPQALGVAKVQQVAAARAAQLTDPQSIVTYRSGYALPNQPFKAVGAFDEFDLNALTKQGLDTEPFPDLPEDKHAGAGMILIHAETGKVILTKPAGGFGGYTHTFPKGTVEPGDSLQKTAIKEVYEETGFQAKIIGVLGDYEKTTSVNRMYIGVVTGGEPWNAHWETEAVVMAPLDQFRDLLNTGTDKALGKDFQNLYEQAIEKGGGNLEKGLDILQGEKAAAAAAQLAAMQQAAYDKWAGGQHASLDELQAALAHAGKAQAVEIAADVAAIEAAIDQVKAQNAANKQLFSSYLNEGPDALDGLDAEKLQSLITWAYETRQPATNIADLEAFAAQGKPVKLPADASKAQLVAHLVDITGGKKWLFSVMTKAQLEGLDGLKAADILAAAEAAGQAHTQKYSSKAVEPEPPPLPTVPLPAHMANATKAQLVDFLVAATGAAKWKFSVMDAGQIKALFGKTQVDILALADEAGAAHSAKYKKVAGKKGDTTAGQAAAASKRAVVEPPGTSDPQKLRSLSAQVDVPLSLLARLSPDMLAKLYGLPPAEAKKLAQSWGSGVYWAGLYANDPDSLEDATVDELHATLRYIAASGAAHLQPLKAAINEMFGEAQGIAPARPVAAPPEPEPPSENEEAFKQVSVTVAMGDSLEELPASTLKKALMYANTPGAKVVIDTTAAIKGISAALTAQAKLAEAQTLPTNKIALVNLLSGAFSGTGFKKPKLSILGKLETWELSSLYITLKYDGIDALLQELRVASDYGYVPEPATRRDVDQPATRTQQPRPTNAGIPYPQGYSAANINSIKKDELAAYLSPILGKAPNTLKVQTKAQLISLLGTGGAAPTTATTLAGGASSAASGGVATPKAPETPLPQFQPPTGAINITGASRGLVAEVTSLALGAIKDTSGQAGTSKALFAIADGSAQGIIYKSSSGKFQGVVAVTDVGSALKVVGVGFADAATNTRGIADAVNLAAAAGKPLELWVPDKLKAQYTAWGFKNTNSNYYQVTAQTASPALMSHASSAVSTQTDTAPVSAPPGAATYGDLQKLQPKALAGHLSGQLGLPAKELEKLPINDLASLVGKMPAEAKAQAQAALDAFAAQAELRAIVGKFQAKGVGAFATSGEIKAALNAIKTLNVPVPTADLQALHERGKALEVEERASSPYIPRFTPRGIPPGVPAQQQLPDPPGFPPDLSRLRVIRGLGGSTGAELVEDTATGKKYVRKTGNNAGHVREEIAADEVYRAMGVRVPVAKLYETSGGPVKLAEYVEGRTLADVLTSGPNAQREKALAQLRDGFAVDALMGNWDVTGASADNILVDAEGNAWRIDNGGSMRYRAQGAKKGADDWNKYPVDLWEMRAPGRSGAGSYNYKIFGDMSIYDIMAQARTIADRETDILAVVPLEARQMVHDRIETMRDLSITAQTVQRDKFVPEYTDAWLEQTVRIRKAGIIDALPKRMEPGSGSDVHRVRDENGRSFDKFRGEGSHTAAIAKFMAANGADMKIISEWMSDQAGSSWSYTSQGFKWAMVKMRGGNPENYYWAENQRGATAEQIYKGVVERAGKGQKGQEKFDKTLAIWHAFVFESIRNIDFPQNHPDQGYVQLMRTENKASLAAMGVKKASATTQVKGKRGALESSSIWRTIQVSGGEGTLQRVPYHRLFGFYWHEQSPGRGGGGFLGDNENEFVFMPEDIPFWYIGHAGRGKTADELWSKIEE